MTILEQRQRRAAMGLVLLVAIGVLFTRAAVADSVDDLINTLRKDPDDKVRLSAAINLGKLKDQRAVGALTDALFDPSTKVRLVAAVVLGKLVDATTPAAERNRAIAELDNAAQNDAEASVRTQAARSHGMVKGFGTAPAPTPATGTGNGRTPVTPAAPPKIVIYVDLAGLKDGTKKEPKLVAVMRTQAETSYQQFTYLTRWGTTATPPTQADLVKAGVNGFYLDATLSSITVEKATGNVTCRMGGEVGLYPRKVLKILGQWRPQKTSSLVGLGKSAKNIAAAKERCVQELLVKMVSDSVPVLSSYAQANPPSGGTAVAGKTP